jgi:ribosomal protein L37AE/L43A
MMDLSTIDAPRAARLDMLVALKADELAAEPRCTFCGDARHQVRALVGGPKVWVCDGCVVACACALHEHYVDVDARSGR